MAAPAQTAPPSAVHRAGPPNALLHGPILPTLLKLAAPSVLAMAMQVLVGIAETVYVGRLGAIPLAAMALVFPFLMLAQQLSAGAMGGGVSSAVSRALGAGDTDRAQALALHAVAIGGLLGLLFTTALLVGGPACYRLLGGQGEVLAAAERYAAVLFSGALLIWLSNTLASVLRGTGNMRVPSLGILGASVLQIALGGWLALGSGPGGLWAPLGMRGVALANIVANAASVAFFVWVLRGRGMRIRLTLQGLVWRREMFFDILRVGAVSMVSPFQSVMCVLLLTGFVARLGALPLAGYAIGQRLEFLLIPISFGIGVAALPMVGMAMGARDVARARRVAWTAGATSALNLGVIGLVVALWPDLWARMFSSDAEVLAHARNYLRTAGPAFAFFGLGLTLYFAAQGAGRMLGPVLAGTARLATVFLVGRWLMASPISEGPLSPTPLFALVGGAMMVYGLATAAAVRFTPWTLPAR